MRVRIAAAGVHAASKARVNDLAKSLTIPGPHARQKGHEAEIEAIEAGGGIRRFLFHLFTAKAFDMTIGAVIMFNLVVVINETDLEAHDEEDAKLPKINRILLAIYCVELVCKLFIYRWWFFHEYWNCLDFFIVALDLFFLGLGSLINTIGSLNFLRVFRLARLLRAFRMASLFPELNLLMKGFFGAVRTMFWGVCMVILILAVWSILAVKFLHPINTRIAERGDYDGCDRCGVAFSSVWKSLITFFQQVVAGDSWGTVSIPIIEEEPWTALLLLSVLVSVSLAMLNLILAVICEAATDARQASLNDQAEEHARQMQANRQKILDFCADMDNDQSGSVSFNELIVGWDQNPEFADTLTAMDIKKDDMQMIFNVLDTDGSGDVRYEEFVDQLHMLKTNETRLILFTCMGIQCRVEERFKALQKNISLLGQGPQEVPTTGKMIGIEEVVVSNAVQSFQEQLPDLGDQLPRMESKAQPASGLQAQQEANQHRPSEETSVCSTNLLTDSIQAIQNRLEVKAQYSAQEVHRLIMSNEALVQALRAMPTMTNQAKDSDAGMRRGCAPGFQDDKSSVVVGRYGDGQARKGARGTTGETAQAVTRVQASLMTMRPPTEMWVPL